MLTCVTAALDRSAAAMVGRIAATAAEEALFRGIAFGGFGHPTSLGDQAEGLQSFEGKSALLEQFRERDRKVMDPAKFWLDGK
jgi:hypothetical protein